MRHATAAAVSLTLGFFIALPVHGMGKPPHSRRYLDIAALLIPGGCEDAVWPPRHDRDRDCHQYEAHLYGDDFEGCMPEVATAFAPEQWMQPQGRYMLGFWRKTLPYRYSVGYRGAGLVEIIVRIYFGEGLAREPEHIESIARKLKEASDLWTKHSPARNVTYRFERTFNERDAHFAPSYAAGWSRKPYFMEWSADWSSRTFAHEIGHMMGLVDEYDWENTSNHNDCASSSLMCASQSGLPKPFHYYVFLGRIRCAQFPSEMGGGGGYPF